MRGTTGPAGPAGGVTLYFGTIVNAATAYYAAAFTGLTAPTNTLSTVNERVMLSARTIGKLRVHADINVTKDVTLTLYKNGVATAITCTIANGTSVASDLTHTVAFTQGQLVALGVSHTAGSPAGTYIYATLESQ